MAILKSIATGNFTSASTWGVVVGSVSAGATNQLITTSVSASPAITGLSNTVDGVMVQLGYRIASPTGTVTLELYNNTTTTIDRTVTINVSDLSSQSGVSTLTYGGWIYFKFGSTITLNGAQSYAVRIKASVSNQLAFMRSGTSGDWNRGLITTTTQAPTTGDTCHVAGEFLSSGSSNSFTVTMDNTSTSLQLSADGGNNALTINEKSTFCYGTTASTNYYLKCAGNVTSYCGATLKISDVSVPTPSTSTTTLELVLTSNGQYGFIPCGTVSSYGATKTVSAKLNADASIGATSLTTDVSTGWKSGDIVGIAGTTRTYTDLQKLTLSADASGTTLTTNALTVAHGGNSTTGVQADLVNLSRNVKFLSQTFASYVYFPNVTQSVSLYYTEFKGFGTATANKYGLSFYSDTITADIRYCSFYDGNIVTNSRCIQVNQLTTGTINFQSCNLFNACLNDANIQLQPITGRANTAFNNMVIIGGNYSQILNVGGTFTNITQANSNGQGIVINEKAQIGTISNINTYGCSNYGIMISSCYGNILTIKSWRCNTQNINISLTQTVIPQSKVLYIDGVTTFGAANYSIYLSSAAGAIILNNVTATAGTTLLSTSAIAIGNSGLDTIFISNSTFGSGHTGGDILVSNSYYPNNVSLFNVNLLSTIKLSSSSQSAIQRGWLGQGLSSLNENGVAGNNFFYDNNSTQSKDTTIYNTSSPSFRIAPNTTTYNSKTEHTPIKLAVKSGDTPTITVAVRKSVVGDGTAYNGTQPRLMLRPCIHAGVTDYTVIATASGAAGSWETLSAALPAPSMDCVYEFYVDCDGSTGWINIDDWNTTYFKSTKGLDYWGLGAPFIEMGSTIRRLITSFFG